MRSLRTLALLTVLLAMPATCHYAPRLAEMAVPATDPVQRQALRRAALAAVERYERLYGDLPAEEWPDQPRRTYEQAKATLADLDRAGN